MTPFSRSTAVAAIVGLAFSGLAGCGSDDSAGDDAPSSTSTTSGGSGSGGSNTDEVTEKGSITINGTEFAVTTLNRCEPASSRYDLDLQALRPGVKINLYGTGDAITDVSVDGSGLKADFGSNAFGEDPAISASSVTDDRTTGTATVGDSYGTGVTVDIAWDVMIPAEIRDCSL